jgi:preprotein translocase subunit Sec63
VDAVGIRDYKEGVADFYDILGVTRRATTDEIAKAYKAVVMKYHPDRHEQNELQDLAEEKLKAANEAYQVLSDRGRRRLYDAGMTSPFQAQAAQGQVQPRSLVRAALVTAGWFIGVPLLFRLSHSPRLFGGLVVAFVIWRFWRRMKKRGQEPTPKG